MTRARPSGPHRAAPDAAVVLPCAIEANAGSVREVEQAVASGAAGIGLFRTELLFLGRTIPPSLDEQRAIYQRVLKAAGDIPVVFRTLDVGGDKPAGYQHSEPEANPALGVRGIRLGLRHPELLEVQLRALLEASAGGELRVMFPMVATVEEVRAARAMLGSVVEACDQADVPVAASVRVGVMIEVPAAALMADALAREVEFFSIGTNDLIQYSLAADRTNPGLDELATALQPAVLRLVDRVVTAAHQLGRSVAVCGEAAADPLAGPLLVGLGVDELSVAPAAIAVVRDRLAGLDPDGCQVAARDALAATTVAEVRAIAARIRAGLAPAGRAEGRIAGRQRVGFDDGRFGARRRFGRRGAVRRDAGSGRMTATLALGASGLAPLARAIRLDWSTDRRVRTKKTSPVPRVSATNATSWPVTGRNSAIAPRAMQIA